MATHFVLGANNYKLSYSTRGPIRPLPTVTVDLTAIPESNGIAILSLGKFSIFASSESDWAVVVKVV